jgi:hypothetical protein
MVPVTIAVNADDVLSGARPLVLQSVSANEPSAGPTAVTGFVAGSSSTTGFVQALRDGSSAGRVYNFTYSAVDTAGLVASCVAQVVVPHDSGD